MEIILLTGAAGFIGHKTAQQLLEQGHQVIGVDNMNDYYDVKLKKFRVDSLKDKPGFTFYELDIENLNDISKLFKNYKFTKVLNLAARAGVRYSIENPHVYMSTNAQGTLNILELMKEHEVKKLVLASTSSLYAGQEMPFVETLAVNEPISPYAATKKAAEAMAYTYHHLYKIDVSIVRYFTVYGNGSRPDMAQFRFMRWIDEEAPIELFGDGSQARDFTHVDDIARGTIAAAMKEVGFQVINLGGGNNPVSINKMIELLENLLDKKAIINNKPFHSADMKETWADISKAKELLDWQPQISLEEGLKLAVEDFKANYDFYKQIKL
jgi:UDP-glucuronate 4-epimerase